jgi:alpha-tubulin suppressor-like RCC1 family protein
MWPCSAVPTPVVGLEHGVVGLCAREDHHCARMDGGTVRCWGYGLNGENGNGLADIDGTPELVVGIGDASAVVCGEFFSCARRSGESVWCWGDAALGTLGDGETSATSTTPVAVRF